MLIVSSSFNCEAMHLSGDHFATFGAKVGCLLSGLSRPFFSLKINFVSFYSNIKTYRMCETVILFRVIEFKT